MLFAVPPNLPKSPGVPSEMRLEGGARGVNGNVIKLSLQIINPIILSLAAPITPGIRRERRADGQKVECWMVSAHAALFNYAGHPAVVIPYKLDREGLPIGVHIVGKRWDESRLLAIAKALSEVTGEKYIFNPEKLKLLMSGDRLG